jgi:hypothetical protein
MTSLSIYIIYKDAWFGASRHLTIQKEVLSTFEEFTLNHNIYLEDNNKLDVCGKDILFSTYQMGFPSVLEMCCLF